MRNAEAEVLICGAGIAGVSTAYQLAVKHGVSNVILADERAPLSLTSDKSTECYRNWWPGPDGAMVKLMNRSIDILETLAEKSNNIFGMNRRGYLFATAERAQVEKFEQAGRRAEILGAGVLRVHLPAGSKGRYQPAPPEGFHDQPDGADLILDRSLIQQVFPYLAEKIIGVLHIRRAGWLSAQQLGMNMLEQAQAAGVRVVQDRVEAVDVQAGQITGVVFRERGRVSTAAFVNAAGPFLDQVGQLMQVDLPVYSELHLKAALRDHFEVVDRRAPMLIWGDPQYLEWSDDDRAVLADDEGSRWLLDQFPSGVHTRPEGGLDSQIILLLWEYNSRIVTPQFPFPMEPIYPEVALRGMCRMLPGLEAYLSRLPRPNLDGGYYTKTAENRPLACPLPIEGAFVIGALSGFGIMSAPALGELLADHIVGQQTPDFAPAFDLRRYENAEYQALLRDWGETWQL